MADPKELSDRALAAWNAHDLDAYERCFAADAEILGPNGITLEGPAGARRFMADWTEAFPDNEVSKDVEHGLGTSHTHRGVFRGTHGGVLRLPDGQELPATGRAVEIAYAVVFTVEGGEIVRQDLYFDLGHVLSQLRLIPSAT